MKQNSKSHYTHKAEAAECKVCVLSISLLAGLLIPNTLTNIEMLEFWELSDWSYLN